MLEQYDTLLTVTDLRKILNIGRNCAYDLVNQGIIPSIRIGRMWKIPKEAVICYLEQWKDNSICPNHTEPETFVNNADRL